MYSWDDCEEIIEAFRHKNISERSFGVHVSYKYGPLTTKRRNIALQRRSELKKDGTIVSGFIKYPAKLMVKHDANMKYVQLEDFSKLDVSFE